MERFEIVIVGAGLAGAAVAWSLAGSASVCVLEQGTQAGAEASAQNAGMMRRLVADPVERALALRAGALLETLPATGEPAWTESPPFRRTGAVVAVAAPGPRADALAWAASNLVDHGLTVELRAGAALAEVAPAMEGTALHRAWWLPEEGVLDAHALISGCLRGARARGASLRLGCPVQRLVVEGGRVVGVETADGRISADQVVLATGAWASVLAARAGLDRVLVPRQRHLLFGEAHPLSQPAHPWCWIDDVGLYVRPEAGGWLCSPCDELAVSPPEGAGSRGPIDPAVRALAMEKLALYLPALAGLRLGGGWTGLRTFAADRRPWLGPDPALEGLWWAAGLGGAGVTCALGAGELVAARMLGRAVSWVDVAAVDPGRPFSPQTPS